MEKVYLGCAAIGLTVLVIQTVMMMFGLGGDDTDVDIDADDGGVGSDPDQSHSFFKFLSLKTLVAFFAFFGLGGLACEKSGLDPLPSFALAFVAGSVALIVVAYLMIGLTKLESHGTVSLNNAVGSVGKVYIRVPERHSGEGKVTVAVQGRTVECKAMTAGAEIAAGRQIRVLSADGDVLEVAPTEEG